MIPLISPADQNGNTLFYQNSLTLNDIVLLVCSLFQLYSTCFIRLKANENIRSASENKTEFKRIFGPPV